MLNKKSGVAGVSGLSSDMRDIEAADKAGVPLAVLAMSMYSYKIKKYIGATFLGMLPGAIAYNFLAGSFGTNKFYVAILVLLVAFGVPLVWWRRSGECKKIRERQ